jgi:hypothetical protein
MTVLATPRLGRPRGAMGNGQGSGRTDYYYMTRARAEAMAETVRAYWEAKGRLDVRVWLEPLGASTVEWVVRAPIYRWWSAGHDGSSRSGSHPSSVG